MPKWKNLVGTTWYHTISEKAYQDFKEHHVVAHIKFDKEKQSLIVQIQD
jgi:hypothetical protein